MRDNQFGGMFGPHMPMGGGMGGPPRPQFGGGMPPMGGQQPHMMNSPSPFGGPMMSPPMGPPQHGGGPQPVCICTPSLYYIL